MEGKFIVGRTSVESAGTVFQLSPNGTGFRVLKTFPQNGEGIMPRSGLVLGSDSTLYGALFNGGRGDMKKTLSLSYPEV